MKGKEVRSGMKRYQGEKKKRKDRCYRSWEIEESKKTMREKKP